LFLGFFTTAAATGQTGDFDEVMKAGDHHFIKRGHVPDAEKAVEYYLQATRIEPRNVDALCRLSMALNWLGRLKPDEEKEAVYKEAMEVAAKAVEISPESPASHYWLGVNCGEYAQARGVLESIFLLDTIKGSMEKVIAMDPKHDSGGAYIVLGRVYHKLPGIMGGSNRQAKEYLKKAIEYGPQRYIAHGFLAEIYMEEGNDEAAEKLLTQAIDGPCKEIETPNCLAWKADALKLMNDLDKKKKQ
jgi:tetratricopeptide (TPR) repeat protein